MNILGKFSLKSTPYSETLKNWLLGLAKSLEEPIFARAEISKVSAPLKMFRMLNEGLNEIPIS